MKLNRLSLAVSALLGGLALPAQALDLYVDSKTSQIFAEPGPGRVKLGSFERVDEKSTESKPAKAAKVEDTELKAVEDRLNKKITALATKPKDPSEAKVKMDKSGLKIVTNDEAFKFSINGRLHADAALHAADKYVTYNDNNRDGQLDNGETVTERELTDGAEIRRFRIEAAGTFYNDYHFKLQPDFSRNAVSLKDAFVKYTGWEYGSWTIGQSKQPYSLQQMMSSNDMVFMERSLEYVWTNEQVNRAVGIRYDTAGQNWSASAGWYSNPVTATRDSDDKGWGAAGRVTWAPWYKPGELLHVGASTAYRVNTENNKTIEYAIRPTQIDNQRPLDTGDISDVDDMVFFDAEAAGAYGPASFETEYNVAYIQRNGDATGDSKFDGWHFDLMYALTGESRTAAYDPKEGVFKRFIPNRNFDLAGGWGGWELKGRIEQVNLNKVGTPGQKGGRQTDVVLGVNWHLNPWFRMMLDYTHVVDIDLGTADDNRTLLKGDPSDFDIVQMRGSLAF